MQRDGIVGDMLFSGSSGSSGSRPNAAVHLHTFEISCSAVDQWSVGSVRVDQSVIVMILCT